MATPPDWDCTLTRDELLALAPAMADMLREFTGYGLCRQANTAERKSLAEKYARLAHEALTQFPTLKLNYMNCKTKGEGVNR